MSARDIIRDLDPGHETWAEKEMIPASHGEVIQSNLVSFLGNFKFEEGDTLLLDLDYTLWNGNFDAMPSYDLKYKEHATKLAPIIDGLQTQSVKVFGFTGKPLFENNEPTNAAERINFGLSLAGISFSDLELSQTRHNTLEMYKGVIFSNPRERKSSVAKVQLIDSIGDAVSSKRIIWIDDQDVEYARGCVFRYPLLCFPFQHELS